MTLGVNGKADRVEVRGAEEKTLTPMTGQVVSVVIGRDGQAYNPCGPGLFKNP
jgi:hypothetical protein